MSHFEYQLRTPDDVQLFGQGWDAGAGARGVVALVHGLGEHSGRYPHLAEALNRAGYALAAFDLRGHGRSAGKRGVIPSYDALLDDVSLLLTEASNRYPGLPLFLYGHSLGANIVMTYTFQPRPSLAGVVATGPALRLPFDPPAWQITLGRLMDKIWPSFTQPNGLETQALSRDPEIVQKYVEDPLVHNQVSGRLAFGFLDAGRWLLAHASELSVPLLLMHGGADRITDPNASRAFAADAGELCSLKIWDGFYHEIHNEPEQAQVFEHLIAWLDRRIQ